MNTSMYIYDKGIWRTVTITCPPMTYNADRDYWRRERVINSLYNSTTNQSQSDNIYQIKNASDNTSNICMENLKPNEFVKFDRKFGSEPKNFDEMTIEKIIEVDKNNYAYMDDID